MRWSPTAAARNGSPTEGPPCISTSPKHPAESSAGRSNFAWPWNGCRASTAPRIVLEPGIELDNHLVLVVGRIDRGNLAGRIGIPERFFELALRNSLGGDPQRRGAVAVHDDLQLRIFELEIAGHIAKVRQRPQPLLEQRGAPIKLRRVRALQRELIQASAEPAADPNPRNPGQFRPQFTDELICAERLTGFDPETGSTNLRALGTRLELHKNPAG